MKSTVIVTSVVMSAFMIGCRSGLYKVSTSEDGKKIDESVRYYEVEPSFAASFIKDNGASPDGILYDEERMPIEISEGRSHREPDKPGWSGVLWMFSLGIFPMCQSEYMTQEITVKSPIGEKTGIYRVDAKRWSGWIPLFVGYPSLADERNADARLPNRRLESVGKDRLVKSLIGEFSYRDYVTFARSKNDKRKAEIARIQSVSEKVDGLLSKNKFDDAVTLINSESKSRPATQECDGTSWAAMRERVTIAHQAFDKKYVQTLISTGKYEDAISFCSSKNSLPDDVNGDLKTEAIKMAVKGLKDANRLISLMELIKDVGIRDDLVMKLKSLGSLSRLTKDQLIEIADASERDDVVLSVIEVINDKVVLTSFLDKQRSEGVFKALLEKIADADAVRTKIWDRGKEDELRIYVSVFGSDSECLKLIKAYPNLLTDTLFKELRSKVSKDETRSAIDTLQTSRLATEMARLGGAEAVARIKSIADDAIRSKIALSVLWKLPRHLGDIERSDSRLAVYSQLICLMSDVDVEHEIGKIMKACEKRIHFEGLYVNIPMQEYFLLKHRNAAIPMLPIFRRSNYSLFGEIIDTREYIDTNLSRIKINRTNRYKLFEKEDGEFWSAFMCKYIPAGKKKSLGETIGNALDSGTYDYQSGYDDKLEEDCYIYKSMKYGTKVIFGMKTGTLVLEEYK